jgi:hypothetical protein
LKQEHLDFLNDQIVALRLLQSGGVEVLQVEAMAKMKKDPKKGIVKRLIRSPADVFYYSGAANDDGCLAIGKDCWAPQRISEIIGSSHSIWRC